MSHPEAVVLAKLEEHRLKTQTCIRRTLLGLVRAVHT